jgi:hypothetical protein
MRAGPFSVEAIVPSLPILKNAGLPSAKLIELRFLLLQISSSMRPEKKASELFPPGRQLQMSENTMKKSEDTFEMLPSMISRKVSAVGFIIRKKS